MATPQIDLLYGTPVTDPFDALFASLDGDVLPPTTTKIVMANEIGFQIVFSGDFTVAGGDVTGGTMTSFAVFAGATKVMTGSGYSTSGSDLYDALLNWNVNSEDFYDLIVDIPIKMRGSTQVDDIRGGESDDTILGRAGDDRLDGWHGDDLVKGGKGDDFIDGGDGNNVLYGGAGNDVFAFFIDPIAPPTGSSKLKDFKVGEDLIGIQAFDEALPPGFLGSQYFHKGTEATTAEQVIIYDKTTGRLFFDVDGTGIEAQFQLARLAKGAKLNADDFFVGFDMR